MLPTTLIVLLACCLTNVVFAMQYKKIKLTPPPGKSKKSLQQLRDSMNWVKNSDDLAKATMKNMDGIVTLINDQLKVANVKMSDVWLVRKGETVETCRAAPCEFNNDTVKYIAQDLSLSSITYNLIHKRLKVKKVRSSGKNAQWAPLKLKFKLGVNHGLLGYTYREYKSMVPGSVVTGVLPKGVTVDLKITVEPVSCQINGLKVGITGPANWTSGITCMSCNVIENGRLIDETRLQIIAALTRTIQPFVVKTVQDVVCMAYFKPQKSVPFPGFSEFKLPELLKNEH